MRCFIRFLLSMGFTLVLLQPVTAQIINPDDPCATFIFERVPIYDLQAAVWSDARPLSKFASSLRKQLGFAEVLSADYAGPDYAQYYAQYATANLLTFLGNMDKCLPKIEEVLKKIKERLRELGGNTTDDRSPSVIRQNAEIEERRAAFLALSERLKKAQGRIDN